MDFKTNDFNVAVLQVAEELSRKVEIINEKSVPSNTNRDNLVIERAKLIRRIYEVLITTLD